MRGTIFKRKSGYAIVIELPRGADGKRRQKWSPGGRTHKEAQARLIEILHSQETHTFVEDRKTTVAKFLDRWISSSQRRVRARTLTRYASLCDTLKQHIGHLPLLQLTPAALEECYGKLLRNGRVVRAKCECKHAAASHPQRDGSRGSCIVQRCSCSRFRPRARGDVAESAGGLSARTVLHCHRVLNVALEQAVRWRELTSNPCNSVDPPRVVRKEMRALSPVEAEAVMKAAAGTRLELFVVLAIATGARRGELLGLRWSDIDLATGTLSFTRTMQNDKTVGELKTARSKRTVPLPRFAIGPVRKHRAQRIQDRLACGWPFNESGFVFSLLPDPRAPGEPIDDKPWAPDGLQTLWRRIVKDAGVGYCRIHDLRHTAASLMLARGVPITTVAKTLGHSNTAVTLSTYAHAIEGDQEIAARVMDEIFGA